MREFAYLDFDVLVDRGAEAGHYRARVVTAPSGPSGAVDFELPFNDLELENFLLRIGRPRRQAARGLGSRSTAIQEFGTGLFEALFHGDLRVTLATSLAQAESKDAGLRMRLRLTDVPELADLPWEFMWDPDQRSFLALSEWTPLIRYLDLPGAVRPLHVSPPLRLLVFVSSPSDLVGLDAEVERARLRDALADLERRNLVVVDTAATGTLAALQRTLRREDYHVFHFIGHGGFDAEVDDGVLAFEDKNGRCQEVQAGHLGMLLHDHKTLRMAVLNSCEGARGGRVDPYAGTAQTLVRRGIPAVVAMQFEITDEAAITFSQTLYESIADGFPVDAAVAQARLAIRGEDNLVEWATPVLYLRAPDGRIFDVEAVPTPPPSPEPPKPSTPLESDPEYVEAQACIDAERWARVVELLSRVSARHPDAVAVRDQVHHARRMMQFELLDMRARAAEEEGRWADATFALERIVEMDRGFRDASARLDRARHELEGPKVPPPPPPPPPPLPPPDRRWRVVVAVGVALIAVVLVSLRLLGGGDEPTSNLPKADQALENDLIIITRESGEGEMQVVAIASGTGAVRRVFETTASAVFPSITRDRKTLAYVDESSDEIRVVSIDGEGDRLLFADEDPRCTTGRRVSWGVDDLEIAQRCVGGADGLYVRSVDGTSTRRLVPGQTRGPTLSKDGDLVAYWTGPLGEGGTIYVVDTETETPTLLEADGAADPAWHPEDERLAYTRSWRSGRALFTADFEASPRPRLTNHERIAGGDVWQPTWSPDGDEIAYRRGDEVCVQDAVPDVPAQCFDTGNADVAPLWFSQ